jgi:FKBP-type peptidyl-prolyl cis-trans isomerase FkpA
MMLRMLAVIFMCAAAIGCGSKTPTYPSQANVAYSQTDLVVGTGRVAANGNSVTVNYTGWLYSDTAAEHKGSQFDTSIGRTPFNFRLGQRQVIAGWDQGVAGMAVGGRRRLVIPPSLGYGSTGSGPIPPNAALVFDIEVLNVTD